MVALSPQGKTQGCFVRIATLDWSDPTPVNAWIKGLHFSAFLHRQVFTNKDDSTSILYLACSDLYQHEDAMETIYQKRWKVEVFHKTLKSHAALYLKVIRQAFEDLQQLKAA